LSLPPSLDLPTPNPRAPWGKTTGLPPCIITLITQLVCMTRHTVVVLINPRGILYTRMNNHTITGTKTKPKPGDRRGPKPSGEAQLFGVVKIRDVWLNDMGDGTSLIWDNRAKKWRKLDEELHDLIITWEWPPGTEAKIVGSESWGKDLFPFVIDYYIAIKWDLIVRHNLEWAVVDTLEAPNVVELPFLIDIDHDVLPMDALELGND